MDITFEVMMKLIALLVTYEIGMLHLFTRSPEGMKMNVCASSDPIHVRTLKEIKKIRSWFNFSLIVLFNY
jgi:hypothetical protein